MEIKFKSLALQNFKSHQDLSVNFGERTEITGDNAKGKSSILEAIIWALYGTDALGSKLDPSPVTYEADETKVSILLSVDGKDLLLGRELKKGKAQYFINEVPSKAGEFNEILDQMFDKDLFLSLFNPNYFFTMHWEKQRAMVLQYVPAPPNKEVLKHLPDPQTDKLSLLLKKHSLVQLEKIHRDNKNKLEKEHIAAKSRTKTLNDQLDQNTPSAPLESLKVEDDQLVKQIKEIEKVTDAAVDGNREFNLLQSQIMALQDQIEISKERWPFLKNEPIEDTCRTCKRPLDEESVKAVQEDKDRRIAEYRENHSNLVKQRDDLKKKLAELEYIDVSEQIEKVRELEDKRVPIQRELHKFAQFEKLSKQVEEAKKKEKEILESLNESIFILDAIKDFRSKQAELQAEKVQSLFENLSIKLFEIQKNGELKTVFKIQMDGKDYEKLSLSEGIRAGLELREVLSQQSGIVTPVFVDNAESITRFKEPSGQLIISRVAAGKDLTIEAVAANEE